MDVKQVIETELRCVQSNCDRDCAKCELVMDQNEIVNAYKQVIEMLEHQPDDCIDRQDMLDAIGHGTTYTSEEIQEIVKKLPRVNSEIIRCKDCRFYQKEPGRCVLLQIYPTGMWFCGNAARATEVYK